VSRYVAATTVSSLKRVDEEYPNVLAQTLHRPAGCATLSDARGPVFPEPPLTETVRRALPSLTRSTNAATRTT